MYVNISCCFHQLLERSLKVFSKLIFGTEFLYCNVAVLCLNISISKLK